jgi:hypothetical protein
MVQGRRRLVLMKDGAKLMKERMGGDGERWEAGSDGMTIELGGF